MARYATFSSPDNVKAKLQAALYYARKKRKARLAVVPDLLVAYDPLNKAANILLSNNNLTATKVVANGWNSVRATLSRSSGKYYFETVFVEFSASFVACGISTSAGNLGSYVGSNSAGVGLVSDGASFFNAVSTPTLTAFIETDVCCVAVDRDAGKVWFRKNNGAWNSQLAGTQNPATGEGGITLPAGALFPTGSVQRINDQVIGRFRNNDFTFVKPTGFLAWNSGV